MKRNETQIQMFADFEGDPSSLLTENPAGVYPMLCTRELVAFPTVLIPIVVGRPASKKLAEMLASKPETIFSVFCQKNKDEDHPKEADLYDTGVFAKLVKVINMPDGSGNQTIIIQCLSRCHLEKIEKTTPYYRASVTSLPEIWPSDDDTDFPTIHQTLLKEAISYINANDNIPTDLAYAINEMSHSTIQGNFICSAIPFSIEDKMKMLEQDTLNDRLLEALRALHKESKLLTLQNEISMKTRYDLDEEQKEYFLKQQIRNIRKELGDGDGRPERKEIIEKAKGKNWNEATQKIFKKELAKLDTIHPQSPDYSIQISFLQTMVDLPWNEYTEDDLSLSRAKRILNRDHYGMEKVKERILEYLAVRALNGGQKSPILCLYGPPGVGKTKIGRAHV